TYAETSSIVLSANLWKPYKTRAGSFSIREDFMKGFSLDESEKIRHLVNVLKEKYPLFFQTILEEKETALLKNIASRLDISEQKLITAIIDSETDRILASMSNLKDLKDAVDNRKYSP